MPRSRSALLAPQLDPVRLGALEDGDEADLEPGADLEDVRFVDVRRPLLELGGGSVVRGCELDGLAADELDLSSVRMTETVVRRLDVPVLRAPRGQLRDVEVHGGRVGSFEAFGSVWRGVHFVGCKLSFVNLRGAELLDVAFTDCRIDELDLVQLDARRVRFRDCRVGRLDVQQATLKHVDLRGAVLEEVVGPAGLRGATISAAQLDLLAPVLAAAAGITVD
ncbi:pentapeptide repeat-containing protein [Nocardioides alkalitolerans]|uniref:pentapeptide repeat-containing protein n=1 Tax=Nocardioides alkalitolerans TaxID=281714 RepID=UPI000423E944|nr:pentapeptide repeat-containing protein [Nocardioides alkalitolerans]